ncbi:MAG: hypothetical protein SW833_09605 [Cyanobacteriota bacterium]|nr:hypothetical protein [Cyanobacteriota bacterium]
MRYFRLARSLSMAIALSLSPLALSVQSQPRDGCYATTSTGETVNLNRLCPNAGTPIIPTQPDTGSSPPPIPSMLSSPAGKEGECARMVAILDEVQNPDPTNSGSTYDPAVEMEQAASRIETSTRDIERLRLSDSTLREYRLQLVPLFAQALKNLRDSAKALETEDTLAAEVAMQGFMTSGMQAEFLMQELRAYCSESD